MLFCMKCETQCMKCESEFIRSFLPVLYGWKLNYLLIMNIYQHSNTYYIKNETKPEQEVLEVDLCVYGGTSGGVMAAVQAKRLGYRVVLLVFANRIGGLTAGGLGATDIGNKAAIGGLSRDFYKKVGEKYGEDISWKFEPSVAHTVFQEILQENDIPVYYQQHLSNVKKEGNQIREIVMEHGQVVRAKMFVDATYEGDLMAKAGVSFHVGREAGSVYNEIYNGVQLGHRFHNFDRFVDPYNKPGVPESGLLPGVEIPDSLEQRAGDHRIQAYNFRMCLTQREDIRVPFPKPKAYDPERYELLARYLATGVWDVLRLSVMMPNEKTDTNNYGGFSSDNIGRNYEWPEGSYEKREEIFQDHVNYTQGMYWFLSHDERVPPHIREEMATWGLPNDEFLETGHFPSELYIREARRMVSAYVMTEQNCVGALQVEDPVGLAAYTMDSHHCRRVLLGGRVHNEGDVQIGGFEPYQISYRSIVPKEEECGNLMVPFCLSASHIAFGSIRMEPVFMNLAQSAVTAAHLAMQQGCSLQQVPYEALRKLLLADGQVLEW